ncbi:Vegetative incompatibility protein HET-E-1 [Ceratobasidium sp. AG-Ba]|nr:Vegetative incompatibility protein HET-E-1 [Ceratobasidium sp. AG-Ba]
MPNALQQGLHRIKKRISSRTSKTPQPSAFAQQPDPLDIPGPGPGSQPDPQSTEQSAGNLPSSETPNVLPTPGHVLPPAQREGWSGLRALVAVLDQSSAMVGPLKQVFEPMLASIDRFEDLATNRKEYQDLRREFDGLFHDLCGYLGGSTPPVMSQSILGLAQGIERELHILRRTQHHGSVGLLERLKLNANINIWKTVDEQAAESRLRHLPHSPAAKYHSAESWNIGRGGCAENTRVAILEQLHKWACDNAEEQIYWLNGMAGTGKTTIAYSFCRRLEHDHKLVASFFCSQRLPECREVNRIIPTISYQFARYSRPFYHAISDVLASNPDAHNQLLVNQIAELLVNPMNHMKHTLPADLVVVIDGLDECDDDRSIEGTVDALLTHIRDLPFKILMTSRPNANVAERMRRSRNESQQRELRLHELEDAQVQNDIRTYLTAELTSPIGLSSTDLDTLVKQYIGSDNFSRSEERLEEVLGVSGSDGASNGIAALYTSILTSAFNDTRLTNSNREEMLKSVRTVVCAREPLAVGLVAGLLKLRSTKSVHAALRPLLSVLYVSPSGSKINVLHESFPSYLFNQSRSGGFHCEADLFHAHLARLCFEHIGVPNPPFNICALESSYIRDDDLPNLEARIERFVSQELDYACRYWGIHLALSQINENLAALFIDFLSQRFLLWMEVMNLKTCMSQGLKTLRNIRKWSKDQISIGSSARELSEDAWRLRSPNIVTEGSRAMQQRRALPLLTYRTQAGILSVRYSPDGGSIASGSFDGLVAIWDAYTGKVAKESLLGHTKYVGSVAYSPDGTRIASCSDDGTIRIWEADTGTSMGSPLQGNAGIVYSIAYSPDGLSIVSGSEDHKIRVWDVRTGRVVGQPLTGHTADVVFVTYSPNGRNIASCANDKTIRIWDTKTGQVLVQTSEEYIAPCVVYSPDGTCLASGSNDSIRIRDARSLRVIGQPLEGHTGLISSVAYSPDGLYLASGSHDHTVRIWNVGTRQTVGQPLAGHTEIVGSVSYSPDGGYIVSCSWDFTICVWNASVSPTTLEPSRSHTGSIQAVACSPDGACVATGSYDRNVCIWDARSGQMVGPLLEGHSREVLSIAYSPDGANIAAGSSDGDICIWNTRSGQMVGEPLEGHTYAVQSVVYSPDGSLLASGSNDCTVRIWEAHTGKLVGQPLRAHDDTVCSVAFSPDGSHIVSASYDKTIYVWNVSTGRTVGQPFLGHTRPVQSVAYSPDGSYIASGAYDGTIRIWDPRSGCQERLLLDMPEICILSVAYSPDGAYIAAGSDDRLIRMFDIHRGQIVGTPLEGHVDSVQSVAYSSGGAYLVSGSDDNTARIWDIERVRQAAALDRPSSGRARDSPGPRGHDDEEYPDPHICGSDCQMDPPHQGWTIDKDGWAVSGDKLLVWIPLDLRVALVRPQNTTVISSPFGTLKLDFEGAKIGSRWHEYFQPQTPDQTLFEVVYRTSRAVDAV